MTMKKRTTTRRRTIVAILFILVALAIVWAGINLNGERKATSDLSPSEHHPGELFVPEGGCVPDSATAVRIAEAVWLANYGDAIYNEKPYRAELVGDSVWLVGGSLREAALGGVAYIEIRKSNGEILGVGHGK